MYHLEALRSCSWDGAETKLNYSERNILYKGHGFRVAVLDWAFAAHLFQALGLEIK